MECCRLVVEAPFSLELTVLVLRRVATNILDQWSVLDPGVYRRAISTADGVARVRQLDERTLEVSPAAAVPLVRRVLGLDISPGRLQQAVSAEPRLAGLAERFAGLRPPRFASLFEAIGLTVPFQQVSLAAGQAMANQLVRRFGTACSPAPAPGPAWLFPTPEALVSASPAELRACGLSLAKARTLQTVAQLVVDGHLCEPRLEDLPSEQVLEILDDIPGIGPWTAGVIALRGLGRLDVFPRGDVGARRSLARLLGQPAPLTEREEAELSDRLGPTRGLVYFLGLASSRAFGAPLGRLT